MVVIVDYGVGNLRSVQKCGEFLGKRIKVTDSISLIKKASKIILPGVGHFGRAVQELRKRKLFTLMKSRISEGVPFLGICVGMQLLLEESEEAPGIRGLGVIKGRVKKFDKKTLVIPHMGWNQIVKQHVGSSKKVEPLFKRIKDESWFYFAHSYYCAPTDNAGLTLSDYGGKFVSSLRKDNVWAVQFHPEKSQKLGSKVFNNFLDL